MVWTTDAVVEETIAPVCVTDMAVRWTSEPAHPTGAVVRDVQALAVVADAFAHEMNASVGATALCG